MFATLAVFTLAMLSVVSAAATPAAATCHCPAAFGEDGVVTTTAPGTQCAYTGGACTWDEVCILTKSDPRHALARDECV